MEKNGGSGIENRVSGKVVEFFVGEFVNHFILKPRGGDAFVLSRRTMSMDGARRRSGSGSEING